MGSIDGGTELSPFLSAKDGAVRCSYTLGVVSVELLGSVSLIKMAGGYIERGA